MAWLYANQQFIKLARLAGKTEHVAIAEQRDAAMRQVIEQHGWDGDYYLRAYDDDGRPLGSHSNKQGTLFLNTQTWAVLAGLSNGRSALELAESRLQTDLGIRSVEHAYSNYDPRIGLMSRKTPGIQENGGVYLHASAFKLVADCLLGRRAAVERGLEQMLPFGRDGEPYVFSNCYFTIENSYRYGTTGQSWGTGTAGWFYVALLNHVFGLQPEMAGLRLNPCLPPSWKNCSVKRPFRGALYDITYEQRGGNHIAQINVNGQEWTGAVLPFEKGKHYQVTVIME
jgi:cellobiose phosphorylase